MACEAEGCNTVTFGGLVGPIGDFRSGVMGSVEEHADLHSSKFPLLPDEVSLAQYFLTGLSLLDLFAPFLQ